MADSNKPLYLRGLDAVERLGNHLPHPFWLFCLLIVATVLLSAAMNAAGVVVYTPETQVLRRGGQPGLQVEGGPDFEPLTLELKSAAKSGKLVNLYLEVRRDGQVVAEHPVERDALAHLEVDEPVLHTPGTYRIHVVARPVAIPIKSLLSAEGLNWAVLSLVENFAHFEPLGLVLVMLMGVSIAEGAGLITAVMRAVALAVPERLIVPVLFALAACGNIGSDAGVVVIPPLAAAIFKQMGKNPITGLLVGYVGATAGFTANLLPAGTDVLAMSLTNAATGNEPEISVLANWYFMIVSVFFLAILGTVVTHRLVEPRLGDVGGPAGEKVAGLSAEEKRGLAFGLGAVALTLGVWLLTLLPEQGILRNSEPDQFWRSPFFKGLVPILFTLFAVGGLAYGKVTGSVKKADDLLTFMGDAMKRMGPYIVLVLAISQFTEAFQFTALDRFIAIKGAEILRGVGFEQYPIPFFVAFITAVAVANLFMGSASAKWAIFAPIFVPMFMSLGYHPAFTQLLYRVGDSITNCVSPLYPYFPLLLGWIADVDKERAKVGTVLAYLVPYASVLLVGWILMLVVWYLLGLPVGPGSPIHM
ncbi:MAG: AbgT family transporter [Myxococcales bacterium]|nr:AbgT family transporter [Myxococcales bacterium]